MRIKATITSDTGLIRVDGDRGARGWRLNYIRDRNFKAIIDWKFEKPVGLKLVAA